MRMIETQITAEPKNRHSTAVSILIDGDNISSRYAEEIMSIASTYGEAKLARVYLDAQRPSGWHDVLGYRILHAGTGKNASDILLTVDAMELLLTRPPHCFIIASSDGDFSHLAIKMRELGAKVIGLGEAKAPKSFRACCSAFIEVGNAKPAAVIRSETEVTPLDLNIRTMIANHSKNGAGMRISLLSTKMHKQHGIRISSRPERTWRAYLVARPQLYDLDPRGPDAMVRFRRDGQMGTD